MGTLAGFVLLVLVTFSTPFIHVFYFLESSAGGGVKFGIWGYCLDLTETCLSLRLGYTFDPQITGTLPRVLALYPAAAGVTFLSLVTLMPLLCFPRLRRYPHPLFCLLSLLSFLLSLAAFVVMIYLFATARERFRHYGYSASFGPSVWMSLAAVPVLFVVALNAGCGTCLGGRFGRLTSSFAYNY
ncbi:hypothetical protein AcV7_006308 [Taiwanofungus camphoratus]|nr:hypothetical protein AcV7_006308 [Antrodia cinnamomea]